MAVASDLAQAEHPVGRWFARQDRALYLLWAVFWLLMVAIAVEDYSSGGGPWWWEPVLWEGSSCLIATLFLILQRRADRRYVAHLDRPLLWAWHHLKWLPLVAVAFVISVYALRFGIYALVAVPYRHDPWAQVWVYEPIKLALFFGLWVGLIFGFNTYVQWQEQRRRLLVVQRSLAEMQLAQLKAQLRPHFFFNALNTISSLMQVDVPRADRLLVRLADLLRATLSWHDREMTSMREELRVLDLYAGIMQERYADRVTLAWRIDQEVLNAAIPALLLQPLLENAFKHGVELSSEPVSIEIEGKRDGARLLVKIRNTGSTLATDHGGVGLRNCRERLHVLYASAASLDLTESAGVVEARVVLPWREHES